MELNDELRSNLNNENISKDELSKLVYNDKIITMLQDALGKVLDGTTSFEEVLRVIEIEDAEDFFESDEQEKFKENQEEKEKKIKQELEEQEKKQKEEKEKQEEKEQKTAQATNNLEIVSLNTSQTPTNQATPRSIPTTLQNASNPTVKAASANTPIKTLEQVEAIDKQKNSPEIKTVIKQEQQQPTPFTTPTITEIKQPQPVVPIVSVPSTQTPATTTPVAQPTPKPVVSIPTQPIVPAQQQTIVPNKQQTQVGIQKQPVPAAQPLPTQPTMVPPQQPIPTMPKK